MPLAGRGMTGNLPAGVLEIARWVLSTGREFATVDLRGDARVTGSCGAALALPLRCRSRNVAVLVIGSGAVAGGAGFGQRAPSC